MRAVLKMVIIIVVELIKFFSKLFFKTQDSTMCGDNVSSIIFSIINFKHNIGYLMMRNFNYNILYFILICISTFLFGYCSTTQKTINTSHEYNQITNSDPLEYNESDEILFDNVSYKIARVIVAKEAGPRYLKKKANSSFWIIDLSLTNRARKPIDKVFNPIFKLEDSVGIEYESNRSIFILEGLEMKMMTEPLNPNVSVQGLIAFDVPKNNKYKLKILSPFYAKAAFQGSVEVVGNYFYVHLSPTWSIDSFEK